MTQTEEEGGGGGDRAIYSQITSSLFFFWHSHHIYMQIAYLFLHICWCHAKSQFRSICSLEQFVGKEPYPKEIFGPAQQRMASKAVDVRVHIGLTHPRG